ncbi:MAG TPA: hypothetical protein VGZ29_01995 [Terriglobia bacterium]|nr:hypothetical protein [Terriglobia bacterium]
MKPASLPLIILLFAVIPASRGKAADPGTTAPNAGSTNALPTGNVTVLGPVACPAGAARGASCTSIRVSCSGIPDLDATLGVALPAGVARGTVILLNSGTGTTFFNSGFPGPYLDDGFRVVQLAWASAWEGANGAGLTASSCRPSTVFKYVFSAIHRGSRTTGFCGQGLSGGGGQLAYSLTQYGLADYFDYVLLAAGPGLSRMDYGCDPGLYTGPPRDLCPLLTDAPIAYGADVQFKVNTWENTTTCGSANPPPSNIARWAADSIVAGNVSFVYPHTAMSWFFCTTSPVNESIGQGSFLIDQVVPKNAPPDVNCYSGTCKGENVWQDPDAVTAAESEMVAQCVANH